MRVFRRARSLRATLAPPARLREGAALDAFISHPFFGHPLHEFLSQAGQPHAVWEDFCPAMGIDPDRAAAARPVTARFGVALEPEKTES